MMDEREPNLQADKRMVVRGKARNKKGTITTCCLLN